MHFLLLIISTFFINLCFASNYQSSKDITQAIDEFLEDQIRSKNYAELDKYQVKIGHIDSRLQLTKCDNPITVTILFGSIFQKNLTLEARCDNPKSWNIKIPVTLAKFHNAVVANSIINKNEEITKDNLSFELVDTMKFPNIYTQKEDLIGMVAKRAISTGQMITTNQVKEPLLIKKNQQVQITYQDQNFEITAQGIALKDGIRNESIQVKNITSKKIIEGTVKENGTVIVNG